jgi:hypothetical protein
VDNKAQRLIVPPTMADEVEHRRRLADRANAGFPKDGTEGMNAPLRLAQFSLADLPDPALWEGADIYVPDASAGEKRRYSDGDAWLILG